MPGDKKIVHSESASDAFAKMDDQNVGSRKDGVTLPPFSGVGNKGVHYPPTSCYDYQYPGHNSTYSQVDGGGDHGSLVYYMPGYNPYATGTYMGVDGQQPYYSGDRSKAKRTINTYAGKTPDYPLDINSRQHSTSCSIPKSILHSQHLRSLNKQGGLFSVNYAGGNESDSRYKGREKNGGSEELSRGPRGQTTNLEDEQCLRRDEYNLEDFKTHYDDAKFYVIKSYSEDDVHKSIKYDVWSSTPNGNKKLDAAFQGKTNVFLFFSVNGSGQFVGVAEMIGPVDYEKNMDFWQLDKWNGFFPVKWHIVKDVPNKQLRHIILENNDNRPVTYTRDTQEVGLKQGLEMLEIFKSYSAKTSLLDDLSFYENREKLLKAKRIALQTEKTWEGSLISLARNLSLKVNPNSPKPSK